MLRALSFNPRVLILDEPTSVLAPSELAPFLDLLRNLRAEGRIVVLITHKLAEAIAVADRITVLRRGRVVARTTPAETSEEELARPDDWRDRDSTRRRRDAASQRGRARAAIENLTLDDRTGRRILDGLSFRVGGRRDRGNCRRRRQRPDRTGRVAGRRARAERRENNFEAARWR